MAAHRLERTLARQSIDTSRRRPAGGREAAHRGRHRDLHPHGHAGFPGRTAHGHRGGRWAGDSRAKAAAAAPGSAQGRGFIASGRTFAPAGSVSHAPAVFLARPCRHRGRPERVARCALDGPGGARIHRRTGRAWHRVRQGSALRQAQRCAPGSECGPKFHRRDRPLDRHRGQPRGSATDGRPDRRGDQCRAPAGDRSRIERLAQRQHIAAAAGRHGRQCRAKSAGTLGCERYGSRHSVVHAGRPPECLRIVERNLGGA